MVKGLWGRKIGMTQVFTDNQVVPVTVIDLAHWYVTQIKTVERDGYYALQIGRVRPQYTKENFALSWLRELKKYFSVLKEIKLVTDAAPDVHAGQRIDTTTVLTPGSFVDVFGTTIGRGFAGVVKRHGFSGGRASHGSKFGRFPGSLSSYRSQGRVIKGKKMPGHMGTDTRVMQNLEVIRFEPEAQIVLVKGSVPGKAGSLVFLQKRG